MMKIFIRTTEYKREQLETEVYAYVCRYVGMSVDQCHRLDVMLVHQDVSRTRTREVQSLIRKTGSSYCLPLSSESTKRQKQHITLRLSTTCLAVLVFSTHFHVP